LNLLQGLNDTTNEDCQSKTYVQGDEQLGSCVQNLQLQCGDSRDENGRHRFIPVYPNAIIPPGEKIRDVHRPRFFWKGSIYPAKDGENCCSNETISFHYLVPQDIYTLEFLMYRQSVFGRY
jgi:glycoprotein-N-acetylgalactosamine 3-beta-galactosyltransferase